tara:strand:- start:542 stop:1192 length:651 start_codon:yes stop_codon:yes gene_type:complete
MNLFITGTNTGVGKTYVSSLICKALAARGDRVAPFKPIVCGERDDAQLLLAASGRDDLSLDQVNPLHFKSPVAPMTAAMIENREIDVDDLVRKARDLEADSDHLIVEGVGGWEVPISADLSMADFAAKLDYPVVVVVDNRLGALNHTILTVRSVEIFELSCLGLILNSTEESRDAASISNRVVLEQFLGSPILAELLFDQEEIDVTPLLELVSSSS